MRVVLDTNVFVSGVFFGGPPRKILQAWRSGRLNLVISPEILEEYRRVGEILREDYDGVDLGPILHLVTMGAELVAAPPLKERVVTDPDDDKFLACALASKAQVIVSGDRALLKVSGWHGLTVLSPRAFSDEYLDS